MGVRLRGGCTVRRVRCLLRTNTVRHTDRHTDQTPYDTVRHRKTPYDTVRHRTKTIRAPRPATKAPKTEPRALVDTPGPMPTCGRAGLASAATQVGHTGQTDRAVGAHAHCTCPCSCLLCGVWWVRACMCPSKGAKRCRHEQGWEQKHPATGN